MDQELLEYLQAFQADNAKRFDELGQRLEGTNQEVRSLREVTTQFQQDTERRFDKTEQRFEVIDGRFDKTERRFDEEFRSIRGRFDEVDQEFRSIRGRFDKLETEVRGVHIEVENLQGVVQLVAEGVTGVTQQLKKQGEEISRRLDTVESFNRLIYKDLDARVKRLEAT